ncbi:sulfotransferase [Pleurocapsa sp. PCC 7319]|uniref:sulfotransferase family protein n=1 Tax=Pleurocapsa sp. PCC 7319 TaxID=118161 RepID=UPI0003454FF0|nr:sulfotransferase [Pleurocapsa sp. PCC 7319]
MPKTQLDFVAVGPFKTGTSWIYNYLLNYQQIALPTKVKETFFFDKKFSRGIDWYYAHFSRLESNQKIAEIAPSYFHSIEASERIYKLNPKCKIIVTLREPVSRLVSFYLHMKQRGEIKPDVSFSEAISQKKILQDTSLYYFHLSRWIKTFGADNVQVIFFERLKKSPEDFAQDLCNKLDIRLENRSKNLSKKVNPSQTPVNHELAKVIYSSVRLLHNLGLHKIVDYGKNLGVKQLLFSKKEEKLQLSKDEFISIFNLFKRDILMLETVFKFDLSDWKEIWREQGITIN